MPSRLRLIYFAQSLRSDWNNGNAHFLRGLMRAMTALGHRITILEPEENWSLSNLQTEPLSIHSLRSFARTYADLDLQTYNSGESEEQGLERLRGADIVILHEWNEPALALRLLTWRDQLGFRLLFHDTHHRASSSPEQMERFGLARFDGIVAFGEALSKIYRERFHLRKVYTLHEAADTTVFHPHALSDSSPTRSTGVVWIGNWGEGERSAEIQEFFLNPAAELAAEATFCIYGVRYPDEGRRALAASGVTYGGYLPNLDAPATYASARLTMHIPRQQYTTAMAGIPTIRVFEALACGIPLLSAPWQDVEQLFRPGDLCFVKDGSQMKAAIRALLHDPDAARRQAERGLETILASHTCNHRAQELTHICQESLQ